MATLTGTVSRLIRDKGFGFIATGTGTEYFFHQSAAVLDWPTLREGSIVTFQPSQGPRGPRAEQVERA